MLQQLLTVVPNYELSEQEILHSDARFVAAEVSTILYPKYKEGGRSEE